MNCLWAQFIRDSVGAGAAVGCAYDIVGAGAGLGVMGLPEFAESLQGSWVNRAIAMFTGVVAEGVVAEGVVGEQRHHDQREIKRAEGVSEELGSRLEWGVQGI